MTYEQKLKALLAKTPAPTFTDAVRLGAQMVTR